MSDDGSVFYSVETPGDATPYDSNVWRLRQDGSRILLTRETGDGTVRFDSVTIPLAAVHGLAEAADDLARSVEQSDEYHEMVRTRMRRLGEDDDE